MYGGSTAQIAVGRYVLHIGGPCGAVIQDALRSEPAESRLRPTPILLRPKLMRGLAGREAEVSAALSALDAGLPVEVSGERGIGKTALLRHLAHHPRAESFGHGIVYLSARHQSFVDLQQVLFEAFCENDGFSKPTEAEIRRGLQETQALLLIDDVHLAQDELEHLFDTAPRCAFVVATRARRLWGEVHNVALHGLSTDDAVALLEREIERSLEGTDRTAGEHLCAALGGSPLRILQAAALICEQTLPPDEWHRIVKEHLVVSLMASIDDKQRRALLSLASAPGTPLTALHIAGIAEVIDIEPSLAALVRRGLVVTSQSRYRLAEGVTDRLRRTEDLKPWASRAITYFSGWAERHARKQEILLQESESLLRVQQDAADARRPGEVLHLGRLLEGTLAAGGRWGAWGTALERCLDAARAIGDRSAEAWALHQLGSRAVCLGETGTARALLTQAVRLREILNDDAGAAASRRNLSLVVAPVYERAREPGATRPVETLDLSSLPLREAPLAAPSRPRTHHASALLLAVLMLAVAGGAAYWTQNAASISSFARTSLDRARVRMAMLRRTQRAPAQPASVRSDRPGPVTSTEQSIALASDPASTAVEAQASPGDGASILIFTPRPGSITSGGPTRLCYAVSEAVQVRLEPGIGEVAPARTLTCLRVTPARTTTYELIASGRDGRRVSQQLVIFVR